MRARLIGMHGDENGARDRHNHRIARQNLNQDAGRLQGDRALIG
jgi:hypothetical protein